MRWFDWLCRDAASTRRATFHDRVRRYFTGALKPPFNRAARERAGFPAAYYETLACASLAAS